MFEDNLFCTDDLLIEDSKLCTSSAALLKLFDAKQYAPISMPDYKYRLVEVLNVDEDELQIGSDSEESIWEDVESEDEASSLIESEDGLGSINLNEELDNTTVYHDTAISTNSAFTCITEISKKDDIANCFSLLGNIQKSDIKEYRQKIFCKKIPLIEPLIAINDEHYPGFTNLCNNTTATTASYMLPNLAIKNIVDKVNSKTNNSYIENLIMYYNSKLTEYGKCPTFPYYHGAVQGLAKIYFHDITDEIGMCLDNDWFNQKLLTGEIKVKYVDLKKLNETTNIGDNLMSASDSGKAKLEAKLLNINRINIDLDGESVTSDQVPGEPTTCNSTVACEPTTCNSTVACEPTTCNQNEVAKSTRCIIDNIVDDLEGLEIEFDDTLVPVPDQLNIGRIRTQTRQQTNNDVILGAEELPDSIEDMNIEEFQTASRLNNKIFYLELKNYPVIYSFMEQMNITLADLMNEKMLSVTEWLSILFQVSFGLAVANREYSFIHNDLHCANIMFKNTAERYIYYKFNNNYYKIPTFGKIAKIIDFARGVVKLDNKWIIGDVFDSYGDAAGQYTLPTSTGLIPNTPDRILPNFSFDLVLLSTSILPNIGTGPEYMELHNMIRYWCESSIPFKDNILDRPVDFNLYVDITKECKNAIPRNVLKMPLFQKFRTNKNNIPKNKYVYIF